MTAHPPCCRAGQGSGYCTTYVQFMPEPLQLICQGTALTPDECLAYRRRWDHQGGPLALKVGLPAAFGAVVTVKACAHLGPWTGRLCVL
jgi:hypothetical protein